MRRFNFIAHLNDIGFIFLVLTIREHIYSFLWIVLELRPPGGSAGDWSGDVTANDRAPVPVQTYTQTTMSDPRWIPLESNPDVRSRTARKVLTRLTDFD